MLVTRKILHYADQNSDKVYIVDVNKVGNKYVVLTTWGKRTAERLSSQIKNEFDREYSATDLARKLIDAKKRGKDPYREVAESQITIPGLSQHKDLNLAHVVEAARSAPVSNVTVELIDESAMKRRVKL